MAKTSTIELTEQERDDLRRVIEICNLLGKCRGKRLAHDDIVSATRAIRSLLGDKIHGSLLERVGLRNMRFLDTARTITSTSDYEITGSNYTITNVRLPLLIKEVSDGKLVDIKPLFDDPNRVKQSAAIEVSQWYSVNQVYRGGGVELDRQETLQLFDEHVRGNTRAVKFCRDMMLNSGIVHNGEQVAFAEEVVAVMVEQIIYEVIETLNIEGILYMTEEYELARHLHLGNELFISNVRINNYKLYGGEREFAFQNRFTVLIGDNATGKTTILDAMRIAIDTIIPSHRMGSKKGISSGIPAKFSLSSVHREILDDGGLDYSWPVEIVADSCYGQIMRRRKSRANRSTKKNNKNLLDELNRLPLIVYCGVERTRPLEKRKIEEKFSGDRYDAYIECLNTRTTSTYLKLWLRDLQQNAKTSKMAEDLLTSFIDAVCSCLKEENITNIQYVYQEAKASDGKVDRIDDIVLTKKDPVNDKEKRMLFGTLSAGYRVTIGMIANLAYRCIILNPQLGKDAITGTSGIVLIDEIDMHLHPLWQRHVVEDLTRCFPKVQFVATTHSPFIIQSLKGEQVFNLQTMEFLGVNPNDNTLDVSVENMDIAFKRSASFLKRQDEAKNFICEINDPNIPREERDKIYNKYAHQFSDDPVFLAKLEFLQLLRNVEEQK